MKVLIITIIVLVVVTIIMVITIIGEWIAAYKMNKTFKEQYKKFKEYQKTKNK